MLHSFSLRTCISLLLWCSLVAGYGCKNNNSRYQQFATQLEKSINDHQAEYFNEHFDFRTIIDHIVQSIEVPADYRQGFELGIQQDLNLGATIVNLLGENGAIKLLYVKDAPEPTAFYRVASSEGVNYIEMYLAPSDTLADKVLIKDFYIYRGGLNFSSTLKRLYYSPLADRLDSINIDKAPAVEQAFIRNLPKIDTLTALVEERKYDQALAMYSTLPTELQRDKMLQVMRLNLAHAAGDTIYQKAVAEYRQLFPNDAALEYLQMNLAMSKRDTTQLFTAIDALDKRIGGDPYLHVIRSDVYYSTQKTPQAQAELKKALAADPDLEDAYWRMIGLLIDGGKYADAVSYFPEMKKRFDVNPASFLPPDQYKAFEQSPEYLAWIKDNPADSSMLNMEGLPAEVLPNAQGEEHDHTIDEHKH